jgi:hypothetical protein
VVISWLFNGLEIVEEDVASNFRYFLEISRRARPVSGGGGGWNMMKWSGMRIEPDRLCGLVVRVLGYRSGGPGSIPGTTRKKNSGSGTGCAQPREYN